MCAVLNRITRGANTYNPEPSSYLLYHCVRNCVCCVCVCVIRISHRKRGSGKNFFSSVFLIDPEKGEKAVNTSKGSHLQKMRSSNVEYLLDGGLWHPTKTSPADRFARWPLHHWPEAVLAFRYDRKAETTTMASRNFFAHFFRNAFYKNEKKFASRSFLITFAIYSRWNMEMETRIFTIRLAHVKQISIR